MMTMKTKRIASLLLSAALLLSLAVPAFAENPTTEETAEPETAVQEVEPEALTEDDAVAPVAEPTAKKEYTYVAIGDSVTAGVGLSEDPYKALGTACRTAKANYRSRTASICPAITKATMASALWAM